MDSKDAPATTVGTSYRRSTTAATPSNSNENSIDLARDSNKSSTSITAAGSPPPTSIGPSTMAARSPVVGNAISPIDPSLMAKSEGLQSPFWHHAAAMGSAPTPVVRTPVAGASASSAARKDRGSGMRIATPQAPVDGGRRSVSPLLAESSKAVPSSIGEPLQAPDDRANTSFPDPSSGGVVPIVERTSQIVPKEVLAPQAQRPSPSQGGSLQNTLRGAEAASSSSTNYNENDNDNDATEASAVDDSYEDIIALNAQAEEQLGNIASAQKRKEAKAVEPAPFGAEGVKKEWKPREKKPKGPAVPEGHVEVPLVKPRYERKYRTSNQISVGDYASDSNLGTVSDMLRHTSVEKMSVRHGDNYYEGTVEFHTYSVFRHGARKIVAQSVGYASDGDLVIHRFDIAERSDSNNDSFSNIKRKTTEIHDAVCLDYKARRPMTDGEEEYLRRTKQINKKKNRKYPGVKAPKNKKIRQRLMNDAVTVTDDFKQAYARAERRFAAERAARGEVSDSDDSSSDDSTEFRIRARGAFQNVPPRYHKLMHQDEDKQTAYLDRIGVQHNPSQGASSRATPVAGPVDPNSAEARFNLLNTRLRDEAKRALVSEYLTSLINELDQDFSDYIRFSVPMVGLMTPPFGPQTPPMLPPPMRDFSTCGDDFPLRLPTPATGEFAFPAQSTRGRSPQAVFPSQPIISSSAKPATDESSAPTPSAPTPTAPKPPNITEIERVASILPDNAPPPLSYAFRDGYGRLICHAVAAYYKLISTSEEDKDSGSRKTFVQFPESKRARAMAMLLPPTPFLQFLRVKTRNNSATPSIGPETPQIGPADDGQHPPRMVQEDTAAPYQAGNSDLTKTAIRKLKKEQKEQERGTSSEIVDDLPDAKKKNPGGKKHKKTQKKEPRAKDESPPSVREQSTPENNE